MKKETRDRLMFGLPMGFGFSYLSMTPLRFVCVWIAHMAIGIEVNSLNHNFLVSIMQNPQTDPIVTKYIAFLRYSNLYLLLTYLTLFQVFPFDIYFSSSVIIGMITFLAPVLFLMYFIKFHMNEDFKNEKVNVELCKVTYLKLALDCLSLIWVSYSYSSLMSLSKNIEQSAIYFGMTVGFVSLTETMALIVGRTLGKNNFSYFISPKKTWEGFVGQYIGIIPALLVMRITAIIFNYDITFLTYPKVIIMGLFLTTVSIFGDLMESIMKRAIEKKDSSTAFKGLGGVLDKFDSLGVSWMLMPVLVRLLVPNSEGPAV